jgi:putative endonuclease
MWHLYIIQKGNNYYTGITTNLTKRIRQHGNMKLLYQEMFSDGSQAARREKQIKGWSRAKKEQLFAKFSR